MTQYFKYYATNEKVFRVRANNREGLIFNHLTNPNLKWILGPFDTKQEAVNAFNLKTSQTMEDNNEPN